MVRFVKNFFTKRHIPNKFNHTNLVLIPKKMHNEYPSDYRPIALCNVLYKVLTKILANRIKPILHRLISPNQSAFVAGRQISDNVITAKELFHSMRKMRGREGALAIKIDMSKAYDRVEWTFLQSTLHKFGFSQQAVDLIMVGTTTSTFSILINGAAEGFIKPTKGIRQGCPLSPYLFILSPLSW